MRPGEDRQRRIVAHGHGRLHAVLRHGKDPALHILVGIAEHFVEAVAHLLGVDRDLAVGDREIRKMNEVPVQPLAVGASRGVVGLALLVGDDPLLSCVHEKDAPRLEPRLFDDVLRLDLQNAHLRREYQTIIVCDVIAGRAQAVPVQRRTEHFAVREQDRGGAVPGFHHCRVVMVEILLVFAHERVVLPRLGDDHHHGERQGHPVHIQEFQCVVEHGRVGPAAVHDGKDLVDVVLQYGTVHCLFSRQHPVDVAADRIDLAVVGDHAVGMRAVPGRERIGGEAGVHDRDGGLVLHRLQVVVEAAQLSHQEHALVDDGPR